MSDGVSIEVTQASLAAFQRTLVAWQVASGKSWREIIRAQGRLIAVNLAIGTQPYGLTVASRKIGEAAVIRDIARVYRSIDTVYKAIAQDSGVDTAKAFYAAALSGRDDVAKHILRGCGMTELLGAKIGTFDKSLHKSARNRRGRVRTKTPRLIVTNPRELREYTKAAVAHVGTGKSGWATCARQLGGVRGLPYWTTKNKGKGTVEDHTGDANNPHVVLQNDVDYIDVICPASARREALEIQRRKMETSVRMAVERDARTSRAAA